MWERGCFPTTILAQLRTPRRSRHPYAAPRTSLQSVCTRRRNCIERLSPSPEYALGTVDVPSRPPTKTWPSLGRLTHLSDDSQYYWRPPHKQMPTQAIRLRRWDRLSVRPVAGTCSLGPADSQANPCYAIRQKALDKVLPSATA